MSKWAIVFDEQAVEEFKALPCDVRARLTRIMDLFGEHGPAALHMPLARPSDGKLWELRASGRDGIARCLYVLDTGREMVVLCVFTKKTRKTPKAEMNRAMARWKEWKR